MRPRLLVLALTIVGCHRSAGPQAALPPPPPPQPKRTVAGDVDLRVMIAEMAAAKACTLIRGGFVPLSDAEHAGSFSGTLWLRDCNVTQQGTHVTFELAGDGWQWAEKQTKKAGGTFEVRQYVRFHVETQVPGAIDVAYAPRTHVAALSFTPDRTASVKFTPIGDLDVDEKGAWASVIGGVSSVFGSSPSELASDQARAQGTDQFQTQLGKGLAATIDLCTGLMRLGLGLPPQGTMMPPTPGDSRRVPVVIQPGGLMIFGPYLAKHGMTIDADARGGSVRLAVMCNDDAQKIAQAYAAGQPRPPVRALVERVLDGHAVVKSKATSCPVSLVVSSVAATYSAVTFDWQRPPREAGAAMGGPLIQCSRAR